MSGANRLARWYMIAVDATDMAGTDGRLSFQKWVLLLVTALWALEHLTTTQGIAVITASFGRTVWLSFLTRKAKP